MEKQAAPERDSSNFFKSTHFSIKGQFRQKAVMQTPPILPLFLPMGMHTKIQIYLLTLVYIIKNNY